MLTRGLSINTRDTVCRARCTDNKSDAVIYQGLEFAYDLTKNESIAEAYEKQMSIINEDGTIKEYEYDCECLGLDKPLPSPAIPAGPRHRTTQSN